MDAQLLTKNFDARSSGSGCGQYAEVKAALFSMSADADKVLTANAARKGEERDPRGAKLPIAGRNGKPRGLRQSRAT
jgi:hypothetical protein